MLEQVAAVTLMNLRSLPQRLGTSWVIVVGIAVTVAVLVSVLAMDAGFRKTLAGTARADRAIVLRGGSNAELSSTISRENTLTIMDAAGVARGPAGKPIASAEAVSIVALPLKRTGTAANVTLRGVGPQAFALRPELHLVAGRMFRPALRELIVGRSAVEQFKGVAIGGHIAFRDSDWTVVGEFDSGGDAHESELVGDIETVLSAFRRNLFQSVTVRLESAQAFDRYKAALTTDPSLSVDVLRETDYYAGQSRQLNKLLGFLAVFVGGFMAVGAMFGALNTMYAAVAARSAEIATLRAIGFSALPVVVSVFAEALLLSLLGGAAGAAAAWMFFNGNAVNTLGANFTQVVFRLSVTPALLAQGIAWACCIGALGGLFPALRAARMPVAAALRAG
ncbi:MAG: ABC transporter permease [Nevskia sp.]|nr:ABC transporter permease [Nevskia sp.]